MVRTPRPSWYDPQNSTTCINGRLLQNLERFPFSQSVVISTARLFVSDVEGGGEEGRLEVCQLTEDAALWRAGGDVTDAGPVQRGVAQPDTEPGTQSQGEREQQGAAGRGAIRGTKTNVRLYLTRGNQNRAGSPTKPDMATKAD